MKTKIFIKLKTVPDVFLLFQKALICGAVFCISPFFGYSQNFWQQTSGPEGGRIEIMGTNPNNGNLFAGYGDLIAPNTFGGSLYRSSDNGQTWAKADIGLNGSVPSAIAFNPTNGHIYLASCTPPNTGYWNISYSSNNGNSWSLMNSSSFAFPGNWIRSMAVNLAGDSLFVGTSTGGVFVSKTNGTTWTAMNNGLTNLRVQTLAIGFGGRLYAGTDSSSASQGRVFRYSNGIWTNIGNPLPGTTVSALAFNNSGNIIYAGTANFSNQFGQLYKSTNNGNSWTAINNNQLPKKRIKGIVLNSSAEVFVMTSTQGVYKSADNGSTWNAINNGLPSMHKRNMGFIIDNSGNLYAGDGAGVMKYPANNSGWVRVNNGMIASTVGFFTFTSQGTVLAGTQSNGIYLSNDAGNTWSHVGPLDSNISMLANGNNGELFAGLRSNTPNSHLLKSTDGGQTWALSGTGISALMVGSFAVSSTGELFAGTGWGNPVYRSVNNGVTWTSSFTGIPTNTSVLSLAINSQGHIFAGTEAYGVYRSLDNGQTYQSVNNPALIGNDFSIAFNSSGDVFAGVGASTGVHGVHRSTDNGNTWLPATLTSDPVFSIVVTTTGDIFAATKTGVYFSIDNASTWITLNSGLNNPAGTLPVFGLAVGADGHLYAGRGLNGIYRSVNPVQPSIIGIEQDNNNSNEYSIEVFPNPSSGTFQIQLTDSWFASCGKSTARVELQNVLGEVIFSEALPPLLWRGVGPVPIEASGGEAQSNSYRIDLSKYGRGVYFLTLKTSTYLQTKKVVIE